MKFTTVDMAASIKKHIEEKTTAMDIRPERTGKVTLSNPAAADVLLEGEMDILQPKVQTMAATDVPKELLVDLFGLRFDDGYLPYPWSPRPSVPKVPAPDWLVTNLRNFKKAGYDTTAEAFCRIPIDCVLAAAKLHYTQQHAMDTAAGPLSECPTAPQPTPKEMRIYPKMDMTVEVDDLWEPEVHKKLRISGKADWAMGHGGRADSGAGSVLLAVKANNKACFGKAESQLLTYLATIKALRQQNCKINADVQGFYSDGSLFRFVAIDKDGYVRHSKVYDIQFEVDAIFNWILVMIEVGARSSPNTTPAKPGAVRDADIYGFRKNVLRFYDSNITDNGDGERFEEDLDNSMELAEP